MAIAVFGFVHLIAVKRTPGPGAICKKEWEDLGNKLLKGRHVILHTDSAKSYTLKIDGVIHDRVVHCKKRVQVKGTVRYQNPKYVALVKHHIPNTKKVLTVKSGTQVIDRCWRFLKDRISRNQHSKAGSKLLRAKLRSAQYEYWHKDDDLWLHSGVLCARYMRELLNN